MGSGATNAATVEDVEMDDNTPGGLIMGSNPNQDVGTGTVYWELPSAIE